MENEYVDKLSDCVCERTVLSGIFQYGEEAYLDVADILQPDSFTDPVNQVLYRVFGHLVDDKHIQSIDYASVLSAISELKYDWVLEKQEDLKYIRSVMNGRVLKENIRVWAAQIRKLHITRLLCAQLNMANQSLENIRGTEPLEQILGIAENAVFDFTSLLHSDERREPILLGDQADAYLDNIEANPNTIVGIASGYPYYDMAIGGGFRRKTVSVVGARLKTGKSFLAANIGINVAKRQIPVLILDTEMGTEDQLSRLLPNLAFDSGVKITINDLEGGRYVNNTFIKNGLRKAATNLKEAPLFYVNVSGCPFEEILAIIRRWLNKYVGFDDNGRRNDCLVVYDYFKLMSSESINKNLQEYQLLGFMMTSLHNFAVRHDIPVLAFTQINRDGIDRESSDVVAGSDRILWLATNMAIYKIKADEEIAEAGIENGNRKLVVVCSRHGQGLAPGDYINMHFHGQYGKIIEGNTKNNIKNNIGVTPIVDVEDALQTGDQDIIQPETN